MDGHRGMQGSGVGVWAGRSAAATGRAAALPPAAPTRATCLAHLTRLVAAVKAVAVVVVYLRVHRTGQSSK